MGTPDNLEPTLKAMRAALLVQRQDIDRKLEAINVLIGEERMSLSPNNTNRAIALNGLRAAVGQTSFPELEPGGFRTKLREAIATHDGPVRAGDIVKQLKAEGFQTGGVTPIGNRIHNELRRMAEVGHLGKTEDGAYFLPKR